MTNKNLNNVQMTMPGRTLEAMANEEADINLTFSSERS
jgi:hypothetical protein